jgi:hypothetical protein
MNTLASLLFTMGIAFYFEMRCHDPDFSKIKISSCIHGILHFKIFSKVLNLIPSKNMVSNAFSQILDTKEFSERKYFTNEPHCYGAILYFPFVFFS